jgi:O-methyltransferase involved in polyketide biosynthesis
VNRTREPRQSVLALKGAAESLLVTLSSRAFESQRASPILRDEKAVQLLDALEYDAAPLARSHLYHTIICLRTRRFDAAVTEFLQAHPDGVVVNLGCGLDTRFERVDNGRAHWIEVDFPEVIKIRRELLAEEARRQFIACSITDLSWLAEVEKLRGRPVFFFAEGVLMFLQAADAERVIVGIALRFPGSSLLFDAVKPIEVTLRRFHPTLRRTQSKLQWGLSGGRAVEALHPSLRLVAEWFYCEEPEPRLGWYRLLRYVPWFGRTAWILRCQVAEHAPLTSRTR